MEKIYTVMEAREYLKVSDSTIRRLIRAGQIKVQRLGREYRITESAIKDFLDSQNQRGKIDDSNTQAG